MAASLPMVVTDVGGNSEAVIHKRTGLVVPARNPALLGEAILSLVKDPRSRRKFGNSGRKRAKEHFDIEACVANYARCYEALLRGERVSNIDGVGIANEKYPAARK